MVTAGKARVLFTTLLPGLVLALLALRATIAPIVSYDSWWYHLPFASCLWDIDGGCQTFHMDPRSIARFQGFPKLWELAQGAVWSATGILGTIVLPQLLLVAAYVATCLRELRIPWNYLLISLLACPMLVLHASTTNNDLPGALAIAIGFFLLADVGTVSRPKVVLAVAAFAVAGGIKYQSLLGGVATALSIGITCLLLRGIAFRQRGFVVSVLALAVFASSAWATANLVRFGNPFYPFEVTVAGHTIFQGPENPLEDAKPPAYLVFESRKVTLPEPVNFVLSITELDWTMRGVAPWYSMGSQGGDQPRRGDPSRTGGWGAAFVMVNLWLIVLQLLRPAPDRKQRALVVSTVLLCLFTALLPRAHELRYWLYLPLILAPVNVRYLLHVDPDRRVVPHLLVGLMLLGLALTVLSPKSRILEPGLGSLATRQAAVPAEVRAALAADGVYCDPDNDLLFRWSSAVTGLPGLLSNNAADCSRR